MKTNWKYENDELVAHDENGARLHAWTVNTEIGNGLDELLNGKPALAALMLHSALGKNVS